MEEIQEKDNQPAQQDEQSQSAGRYYKLQFRETEQVHSAFSKIPNLTLNEIVLAQTDHGLEPAMVLELGMPAPPEETTVQRASFNIIRRATREEIDKYNRLIERELEAFGLCQQFIRKHSLAMKLIKVERFFNGSKIIFYFTAENRVDFRELVKDLVQEFRTRVEIRQVGVRHETKLIGGIGCCGRELCCSSFISNFAPVSIKMAKDQDLPLNPSKISGICNRLLCCLTYEFESYRKAKKNMPRPGRNIVIDGKSYHVLQNNVLQETITVAVADEPGTTLTLNRKEWSKAVQDQPRQQQKKKHKKQKN